MNHLDESRLKRKQRIRRKISGTPEQPRLTVYKSLKHIYAQVVDDSSGRTLVFASDLDPSLKEEFKAKKHKKSEVAQKVGALVAKRCVEVKIEKVVFDRNGFPYHGRVSAVADAARKAGLKF
ncbi:MAG: 50S ribosomal protein L18 [Deltaproteobacteria bacterium]|nr:50S ribosomal protein L18 [Deltaproteobacteria bacterium]